MHYQLLKELEVAILIFLKQTNFVISACRCNHVLPRTKTDRQNIELVGMLNILLDYELILQIYPDLNDSARSGQR